MSDSVTPWTAAYQTSVSFSISWNLLKLMFIESMMSFVHCYMFCVKIFWRVSSGSSYHKKKKFFSLFKIVYYLFQNFPQFIVIHTVKGFGIVNKAEIDVFLELSCFFDNPSDVGKLISGSSVFSKTSLNIWKFTFHVLLKPSLENFEHYITSV